MLLLYPSVSKNKSSLFESVYIRWTNMPGAIGVNLRVTGEYPFPPTPYVHCMRMTPTMGWALHHHAHIDDDHQHHLTGPFFRSLEPGREKVHGGFLLGRLPAIGGRVRPRVCLLRHLRWAWVREKPRKVHSPVHGEISQHIFTLFAVGQRPQPMPRST